MIFPLLSQMGLKISSQQAQQIIKNALIHFHYQQIDNVKLSKRESECLYYLSKGRTIKDIAKFLKISHRTVEDYIGNIKSKLNWFSNDLLNNTCGFTDSRLVKCISESNKINQAIVLCKGIFR